MGSSHSDGEWDRDGKGVPDARMWEVWIDRQRCERCYDKGVEVKTVAMVNRS